MKSNRAWHIYLGLCALWCVVLFFWALSEHRSNNTIGILLAVANPLVLLLIFDALASWGIIQKSQED